MSILAKAKPQAVRPPIITLMGDAGVGKTTLAATFPKPIFLAFEHGAYTMPAGVQVPDSLDYGNDIKSFDGLMETLRELHDVTNHDYKTIVFDTINAMDRELAKVVERNHNTNIASIPYGKGYAELGALHKTVTDACLKIASKGITIIYLAHTAITTVELPDEQPYMRFSLPLHSKSEPYYIGGVDVAAMIRTSSQTDSKGKVMTRADERVLVMRHSLATSTKNRYGVAEDFYFKPGENPLLNIINDANPQPVTEPSPLDDPEVQRVLERLAALPKADAKAKWEEQGGYFDQRGLRHPDIAQAVANIING